MFALEYSVFQKRLSSVMDGVFRRERPTQETVVPGRMVPTEHSRVTGKKLLHPFFSWGLSPAGTFPGEDSCLQRRMGLDRDLRNGTLPLGRRVEEAWLRNRMPRFRIRACSAPAGLKLNSLRMPIFESWGRERFRVGGMPTLLESWN